MIEIIDKRPLRTSVWERNFFKSADKPAFLVGKRFEIEFVFVNPTQNPFQSCMLEMFVEWPNSKLKDFRHFPLPTIPPNGRTDPFVFDFGLIEPGYGLIYLRLIQGSADTNLKMGETFYGLMAKTHIETVFAQTKEEFYQYWAMILAAVGLIYFLLKDVAKFLFSLIMGMN